jgi:hypothetical protein
MKHLKAHKWSLPSSTLHGGLIGIAVGALHQIYRAVTNDIPEDIYTRVVGEVLVWAISGAILFVIIAIIRNRLLGMNNT